MADYGMMGGIGEGLQSFMQTYMQQRNAQNKSRQDTLDQALKAKLAGVKMNSSGDAWEYTPEKEKEIELGKLKSSSEMQKYDPTNPHAGFLRNIAIQQIKSSHPEYSDEQVSGLVPEGLSADQYKEATGLLKPELSGYYSMKGREAMANVYGERNKIQREGLNLRQGQVAEGINKKVMNDKIVSAADSQQAAINKGLDRLNSGQAMTPQMFNEVQIDLANAITGGRTAAQGTIHRVEMDNMASKIAEIQQKLSSSPTDINAPAMKKYLKDTFTELRNLNKSIRQKRVKALTNQSAQAYGTEGSFGNVINNLNEDAAGENLLPDESTAPIQEVIQNGWVYDKNTGKALRKAQ